MQRLRAKVKGEAPQTVVDPIPRHAHAPVEEVAEALEWGDDDSLGKRRRGRPVERLVLGPDEKAVLQRYVKQVQRSPQLAMRAQIVLACAEGRLNGQVARDLRISIQMVGRWRRRFVQERLQGLETPLSSAPVEPAPVRAHLPKTADR